MKVITEGHLYELVNFETPEIEGQNIQFIHKERIDEEGKVLKTISDGTTNEEVLEMLIDRMKYLDNKVPSRESKLAIANLEEALTWLNKRTANRKERGVEGTHQK